MDDLTGGDVESVLERAVAAAKKGTLDQRAMLWAFAASSLYISSATEPSSESMMAIQPLVLTAADGQQLLALFTAPGRATDYAGSFPFLSVRLGFEVISYLPPEAGLVVNPAGPVGFELRPADVIALRDELTAAR
jgi:hypothetical protein